MEEPVCMELKEGLRPSTAAAIAAAEGVRRGMGEEMEGSLLGLGRGLWVFSIVGVPMRAGLENSFIFEDSFFSLPMLMGVGMV